MWHDLHSVSLQQGQSAFDVAEPQLLKLLEELKKKQATVSSLCHNIRLIKFPHLPIESIPLHK